MDKNTIIGFLLIGVVLIVFTWLNQPTPEQIEAYTTVGGTPHLEDMQSSWNSRKN